MFNVHTICDYIILMCSTAGEQLSLLKLQKLLYYVQAWHLAFYGKPLFEGQFQAWVHGPVNRTIYDRFAGTKALYSLVVKEDITPDFNPDVELTQEAKLHIDSILEAYADLTGSQLEALTHNEDPWQVAREGYKPAERCENVIDEARMAKYYAARLEK